MDGVTSPAPLACLPDASAWAVSVIIPARPAASLGASLDSLVHQTEPAWEALILDDGPAAATPAVAEGWARRDRRIRALRQANAGLSAARNRGLREARHPFILFLDAGNRLGPTCLERMAAKLRAEPALYAVYCAWQPNGFAP